MSGGSYGFLGMLLEEDAGNAFREETIGSLERMRDRLFALGHQAEGDEMHAMIVVIKAAVAVVGERVRSLQIVLHGVEWTDSGDWSESTLESVLRNRRERMG